MTTDTCPDCGAARYAGVRCYGDGHARTEYPLDTPVPVWDVIGFGGTVDGERASVRTNGGRTAYEAVLIADGGTTPRLARLEVLPGMRLRQVNRYLDPDDLVVIFLDPR